MDEDVLRPADIKVPTLEGVELEGPGIEDGSFGTAIIKVSYVSPRLTHVMCGNHRLSAYSNFMT